MQLKQLYSLNHLNTLRLSSTASYFVELTSLDQLKDLAKEIKNKKNKFLILGGGSNLILPLIYDGLVIHNQLKGFKLIEQSIEYSLIRSMAGVCWDELVEYTLTNNYFGLENLSLIPGTVGGAPIQNIGAYGVEVKDFIEYVEVYDVELCEFKVINNIQCDFSYRNSIFKTNPNYIVVAVVFRLLNQPKLNVSYGELSLGIKKIMHPTAIDLRNIIIDIRSNKLPNPQIIGNVGSFFHNPIVGIEVKKRLVNKFPNLPVYPVDATHFKISAGWLIDNLGLKGYREGDVGVYNKQALVLVNYGNADKVTLLKFARFIQSSVLNTYDVEINIEPIIVD